MDLENSIRVAVLYNFVGVDEYESLRKKIQSGEIQTFRETGYELDEISTLREEIQSIVDALRDEGFDAYAINVQDSFAILYQAVAEPPPDVIFNLIEWFNEDAGMEDRVAAFYDLMLVPYTGAPPTTLSICQRKVLTKQILKAHGIPTPRYRLAKKEPVPKLTGLRYPMIVKPSMEDASVGVTEDSIVEDRATLEKRVRRVLVDHEQPALIEEFIAGRELGVSILGNDPPRVLPIEEMDFSALPERYRGIISFESKWDPLHESFHKAQLVCPAKLSKSETRRAGKLALKAYRVMGCRDYARVDMRLDQKGRLFVLEVNPNPDLTEGVAFMSSAEAAGLSFGETLATIVESAYARRWTEDEEEVETEGPEPPPATEEGTEAAADPTEAAERGRGDGTASLPEEDTAGETTPEPEHGAPI